MELISKVFDSIGRNVVAEWHIYAMIAGALTCGMVTDLSRGRGLKRYFSREVRTDAIYAIVDLSHLSHWIVIVPLATMLTTSLSPYLGIEILRELPSWVQILVAFVFIDFWAYWYHRAQHSNRWLWQFHKVHHSQQQLTSLTVFRSSIIDRMVTMIFLAVPTVAMSTGAETPIIMLLILQFHQTIEHSDTAWTFGPFGKMFVSPAYHEAHHSTAPGHRNQNYSPVLTVWDHLFGSYAERGVGELNYGLSEECIPESFLRQLFVPIRGVWGEFGKNQQTSRLDAA